MDPLYVLDRFFVLSHVAAGTLGLFVAPVAMLTLKGARAHRIAGQVFFWAMGWILASTLGLMFFRFNFFLLAIAVLSFYSAFTGYRVLKHKRPEAGQGPSRLDWAASLLTLLTGLGMIGWGVAGLLGWLNPYIPGAFYILAFVFGGGMLASAIPDLRRYRAPAADRNWWWYEHMNRMLGAYIAMVTAFLVQNVGRHLPVDWQWVVWVAPGVIGGVLTGLWISHYRRQFEGRRAERLAPAAQTKGA